MGREGEDARCCFPKCPILWLCRDSSFVPQGLLFHGLGDMGSREELLRVIKGNKNLLPWIRFEL